MSSKSRRNKRDTVLQETRRGGGEALKTVLAGMALALIATVATIFSQGPAPADRFPAVQAENGAVRLPVASVSDGKAHFFTYEGVDFFVLKSSDGVLRAAFDTCDTCYRDRKGYRQEGDLMVCNKCEQQFPSALVNERRGGCNPAPLERAVEGDTVVFRTTDLQAGERYFQ